MGKTALLILGGIAAGFVNGLLGTGGGIILIFVLEKILKDCENRDIFALTLTVTLGLSIVSAAVYLAKGGINLREGLKYALPACAGGFTGAVLLDRLKNKWLNRIFGVLVIIAGANMAGLF